eukprot:scaffold14842_cov15-Tisochrysis_lutea.AAC.1
MQSGLLVLDEGKKVLLLQVALKCADLGHMAESWDVHFRYVEDTESKGTLGKDSVCKDTVSKDTVSKGYDTLACRK